MIWVVYAIMAHVGNAVVFVADKTLLTSDSTTGNPIRFAVLSGLVAAGVAVILPFVWETPTSTLIGWSLLAGVLWVLALWLFFVGLQQGEPSRVVPLVGSAVPLFTLIISVLWLGESLTNRQLGAVVLLITGGAVLSLSLAGVRGLSKVVVLASLGSGAAFAGHFTTMDALYNGSLAFLPAFAFGRLGVGVVSVALFGLLYVSGRWRREDRSKKTGQRQDRSWFVWNIFWGSKVLATGALVLQNYAISLGSVTVVNALQGTQYLFLLLFTAAVSLWWPRIFREEMARVALAQKLGGIVLVGIGLILLIP